VKKRDFNHIIISPYLKMFGQQMMERWNLTEMTVHNFNPQTPVIVLGMHRHKIPAYRTLLNLHKDPMIIFFGGHGDLANENLKWLRELSTIKQVNIFAKSLPLQRKLKQYDLSFKEAYIPFKDYSAYKSVQLGKKIYCHLGLPTHKPALNRLGWDSMVKPLIRRYGKDLLYVPKDGRVRTQNEMIKIYNQSCVYIKPTPLGGSTTMWDMGYMGRKTISHGMVDLPHIINGPAGILHGKNLGQLYRLIDIEREKVGQTQDDIAKSVKSAHEQTDVWLTFNYWKK